MTRVLVQYKQPADPAAFDRYYFETHTPLAKKIPGLKSLSISSGRPAPIAGAPPPYLIAELEFENESAFQAAMASPEGQATVADLANFAQAGVNICVFEASYFLAVGHGTP